MIFFPNSLPFTEAVLMEAQRMSTIAPFTVPHYALKETQLQGYTIPKVPFLNPNASKLDLFIRVLFIRIVI